MSLLSFIVAAGLGLPPAATPTPSPAPDDPRPLVGVWAWSWKDEQGTLHQHALVVEPSGDSVAARERYDEEPPIAVTDLKLDGKMVSFTVLRGKRRSAYTGTLKARDLIEGLVNVAIEGQTAEYGWEAKREPAKP